MKKRGKKVDKKENDKKEIEEKNKKAVSNIIVTIIIVALGLILIFAVWVILQNTLERESEISDLSSQLTFERIEILNVQVNGSQVIFSVRKSTNQLVIVKTKKYEFPPMQVDIFSTIDLSGSMRACHGTNASCCVNVLGGNYYSTCSTLTEDKGDACINQCNGIWDDKLTATQNANRALITELILNNTFNKMGLIGYNNSVVNYASIGLTNDTSQLDATINFWEARGTTCICCGINEAISRFLAQSSPDKLKAMIVMTDGEANVECSQQSTGDSTQDAIQAACDANSTLANLTIYGVGAGTNADEDTLRAIAACGGGQYYSVADTSQIINVYKSIAQQIRDEYDSVYKYNYLSVIFYNESEDAYKESTPDFPNPLEVKTYDFDLQGKLSGKITKIEIYPIIVTSFGKEVIGPLLDVWEIKYQ